MRRATYLITYDDGKRETLGLDTETYAQLLGAIQDGTGHVTYQLPNGKYATLVGVLDVEPLV